jgi:DNA polymerase elongation subunit (family B)
VHDLDAYRRPEPSRQRLLFFDVESAPAISFIWDLKVQGGYINPSMLIEPPFLLCWSAKWADSEEILSARLTGKEAEAQDDRRIVDKLADLVRQADIVCGHNVDRFDLPKLNQRIAVHQLTPLGNVRSVDTLKKARQAFRFPSNRLDELAKALGLDGKMATGFDLWRKARAGHVPSLKYLSEYCDVDVLVLERVYAALSPHFKNMPRLVDAGEWGAKACPSCGSADLEPDGLHRTSAQAYKRFRCTACGRHCRSFRRADVPMLEMRPL